MSNKKLITAFSAAIALAGIGFFTNSQTASARTLSRTVVKMPSHKTFSLFRRVSGRGPSGRFASTANIKTAFIQSRQYVKTKKGTYWKIYADGHDAGWVNQNFFVRNKIAVAKQVDMVSNPAYKFNTRDAISYATDGQGTIVNNSKVKVSKAYISTQGTTVEYRLGKAKAKVEVKMHDIPELDDGGYVQTHKGFKRVYAFKGSSKRPSRHWNRRHYFGPETQNNTFRAKGLTLRTRLFEPDAVSLPQGPKDQIIGTVPEGLTVNGGIAAISMYNKNNVNSLYTHMVTYNLNHLKNTKGAQYLRKMSWGRFGSYARNIKVSPLLKLGHGQALGSSKSYIYVVANNAKLPNPPYSEEILQIRKSDLQINHIWTFKIDNNGYNRYIHNAVFVGDNKMYATFNRKGDGLYEYWELNLVNGVWKAKEIGETTTFTSNNSPCQGFTYGNGHFYIAFNDNIFKVTKSGKPVSHYHFNIGREIEGLSYSGNRLYVQFDQRPEITSGIPR